jgi:hypothetical protein
MAHGPTYTLNRSISTHINYRSVFLFFFKYHQATVVGSEQAWRSREGDFRNGSQKSAWQDATQEEITLVQMSSQHAWRCDQAG